MADNVLSLSRESLSLRQQVTDRLREAILSGHFEPGEKLVERDLCERLQISRALLREALQHLSAEGLITIVLHKGPMVARIDADEAKAIYAVRQCLEGLAGEGFARGASDEQVARLRAKFNELKQPRGAHAIAVLVGAKNGFYSILLEGCGNRVVGQMLTQLNNRVTLLRRMSLGTPGRLPKSLRELEGIVRAIEARDPDLARRRCSDHVANAARVVARHFEAQRPELRSAAGPAKRRIRRAQ
jgi:GntR family transcriptional regulator, trigonelline degradation regulator